MWELALQSVLFITEIIIMIIIIIIMIIIIIIIIIIITKNVCSAISI